jgi:hypothetical protein
MCPEAIELYTGLRYLKVLNPGQSKQRQYLPSNLEEDSMSQAIGQVAALSVNLSQLLNISLKYNVVLNGYRSSLLYLPGGPTTEPTQLPLYINTRNDYKNFEKAIRLFDGNLHRILKVLNSYSEEFGKP